MTKIKQAWAWLKKDAPTSEKRGDDNINKIVWIAVVILVIGIVAGVLIFLVNTLGDDASEEAQAITDNPPAVYDANCQGGLPKAVVARVIESAGTNLNLQFTATDGNYEWAAGVAFGGTAGTVGNYLANGVGVEVGLLSQSVVLRESTLNADIDGDGDLSELEILGFAENGAGVISPAAALAAVVIPEYPDGVNALAAGNRLLVNSGKSCWKIA